ncbi:MAG: 30S ribosomal protein S17 [Proteobacteria bacterium]|jgi:small subunit ribosomal protein S17|nr:30S ribosomal protein S17 [Pseudomonadota bacterium]
MSGRTFQGVVTSAKMQKTIVVSVGRQFQELRTGKIVKTMNKYKVHCEDTSVAAGDKVEFVECRPLSKNKRFRFLKLVGKAIQAVTPDKLEA